jgi:DNA-binding NtrC family response regulator
MAAPLSACHGGSDSEDRVSRKFRTALVVEDDAALRTAIATFLRSRDMRVVTAGTASEALAQLRGRPDVVVLDVMLPDGDSFRVLEQAAVSAPAPIRVAMSGEATPKEAFRLAKLGVRQFLQKPVSLDQIWDAICAAAEEPPELAPVVQEAVGQMPLKDLVNGVRDEAIRQALAISKGNRTRAARILHVTRQAVQQMLRQPDKRSSR